MCAQYHCDKHVVKMVLEHCQLMSTAHRLLDGCDRLLDDPIAERAVYKVSHHNHPCAVWLRLSRANYEWLIEMTIHLFDEYTYRYEKTHKSSHVFYEHLTVPPRNIPDLEMTPFAQAMPDECRNENVVEAYRAYYIEHKNRMASWRGRSVPDWFKLKQEISC